MKNLTKKIMFLLIAAVSVVLVVGCDKKDTKAGIDEYTYNTATSVLPTNWNPFTYKTATGADILDYCQTGFYEFDYNDDETGYELVPAMAKELPEDVTSQYIGQYGVEDGDKAKVYKIKLRDGLQWNDKTEINAQSFINSAKLLLDPVAQNYRADSLYSGNLVIYNAKNYLYQGQYKYTEVFSDCSAGSYVMMNEFTTDSEGNLVLPEGHVYAGEKTAIDLSKGGEWSSNSLNDYGDAGFFITGKDVEGNYIQLEAWTKLTDAADDDVVVMTTETVKYIQAIIAYLHGCASVEAYAEKAGDYAYVEWEEMAFVGKDYTEVDFSEVGIFVDKDGDLCLALTKPLEGFYLLYSLTGSWLVHEKIYEKCAVIKDGVYSNSYGTSASKFASYGPYMLESYQADKQYTLAKNPNWFGYKLPENEGLYQTTKIKVTYIEKSSTKLEAFIKGELDVYGLTSNDMEEYGNSEARYDSKGASTFFVAFNPDKAALEAKQSVSENVNKTILTVKEFRQALSLSLDRKEFCSVVNPSSTVATAVFNSLIVSEPDLGTPYRDSEEAKDIILAFWGLTDQVGEGKTYKTKEEAISKITGVDLPQAKQLFNDAYDIAIEQGLLKETDTISLTIGLPSGTAPFYVKGYEYLEKCWKDAVKGTKLEGKLVFTKDDTIGDDFGDRLRDNSVDILFGVGWQGAALDPYSLIFAYTHESYQYDKGFSYGSISKDVHFDEVVDAEGNTHTDVTLRASVAAWSNEALQGEIITAYVVDAEGNTGEEKVKINAGTSMPNSNRVRILWACEAAILEQYNLLPLTDESSAVLKGQQIEYYKDDEVYGMGRGGIKYMKYTCDDYTWNQYVKEQGGKLNYK